MKKTNFESYVRLSTRNNYNNDPLVSVSKLYFCFNITFIELAKIYDFKYCKIGIGTGKDKNKIAFKFHNTPDKNSYKLFHMNPHKTRSGYAMSSERIVKQYHLTTNKYKVIVDLKTNYYVINTSDPILTP